MRNKQKYYKVEEFKKNGKKLPEKKIRGLFGTLDRVERKEDLTVLWNFDSDRQYPIPKEDQNDVKKKENVVKNQEWGNNYFTIDMVDDWAKFFWGDNEKIFPLSFDKADVMINKSKKDKGSGKGAALTLEVTGINNVDKNTVKADWEPFDRTEWEGFKETKEMEDVKQSDIVENDKLVFKLDPYFFSPWETTFETANPNEFKVFKAYIMPNDEESPTFPYRDENKVAIGEKYAYNKLYLVGRLIDKDKDAKEKELKRRAAIMVAESLNKVEYDKIKNDEKESVIWSDEHDQGFRFIKKSWSTDGPTSHGGSGDMP